MNTSSRSGLSEDAFCSASYSTMTKVCFGVVCGTIKKVVFSDIIIVHKNELVIQFCSSYYQSQALYYIKRQSMSKYFHLVNPLLRVSKRSFLAAKI